MGETDFDEDADDVTWSSLTDGAVDPLYAILYDDDTDKHPLVYNEELDEWVLPDEALIASVQFKGAPMTKPPITLWLQWEHPDPHEGATWCVDKIHDDDIEYVLKEWVDEKERILDESDQAMDEFLKENEMKKLKELMSKEKMKKAFKAAAATLLLGLAIKLASALAPELQTHEWLMGMAALKFGFSPLHKLLGKLKGLK